MLRVVSGGLDRLPSGEMSGPSARGRTLILVAALLAAGLVYVNVGALEAGDDFGRFSLRTTELQRENTQLRARIAQLGSTDRIQRQAAKLGLRMPAPEQFTFVRADGGDPLRATRNYTVPLPKSALPTVPSPSVATGPATGAAPQPTTTAPPTVQSPAPGAVVEPGAGAGSPATGANPAVGGN